MSVNTIIDNYYEDLTSAQIDKLEREHGNRTSMESNSLLNYPSQEKQVRLLKRNYGTLDFMIKYGKLMQQLVTIKQLVWLATRENMEELSL